MIKPEIGLSPDGAGVLGGAGNRWDTLQKPGNTNENEQNHERESILQRIGRIISDKAKEIVEYFKSQKEAELARQRAEEDQMNRTLTYQILHYDIVSSGLRNEMINRLPEESRDRVKFVSDNIDVKQECPSTGRSITDEEAFSLYDDYSEHIANMNEDERPHTKLGVLLEMENMLEGKMDAARNSGDEAALKAAEEKYNMVEDLESIASIPEYYNFAESINFFGSDIEMRRYIREKLRSEGYSGTPAMREEDPPRVGGALGLEATLGTISLLDSDAPISEIWDSIDDTDREGSIDWGAVECFSPRGQELYAYFSGLRAALEKRNQRDDYHEEQLAYAKMADVLESDTPFEELPDEAKEAIENAKFTTTAERLRKAAEDSRIKVIILRGEAELDENIQHEVEESGMSREEYANYLEEKAVKYDNKAADVERRNLSEKQFALISSSEISRDYVASQYRESAEAYEEAANMCNQNFEAFRQMFERGREDFVRDVLAEGQYDVPEYPKEVADFLYQYYHYDSTANTIGAAEPQSREARYLGLRAIARDVEARIDWLTGMAESIKARYGEPAFDLDDNVGLEILSYEGDDRQIINPLEPNAGAPYIEKANYLKEQILPVLNNAIDVLKKDPDISKEETTLEDTVYYENPYARPTEIDENGNVIGAEAVPTITPEETTDGTQTIEVVTPNGDKIPFRLNQDPFIKPKEDMTGNTNGDIQPAA